VRRDEVLRLFGRSCDDVEGEYVDELSYDNAGKLADLREVDRRTREACGAAMAEVRRRLESAKGAEAADLVRR
jgi:hypothetical protein